MEAIHKFIGRIAALLALAGGAVLVLMVVLTCLSIGGRALVPLGLGAIPGDVELVEMGVAFAVFSFFPWCQYKDGHARVDLIQRFLSPMSRWILNLVSDVSMFAISLAIATTLVQGMLDKFEFNETTFILRLPLWPGYALCLVGAFAGVLVAGSCLLQTVVHESPFAKRESAR
jgi:TRAP-type C4-dicarboxylate transport system permease small subunit